MRALIGAPDFSNADPRQQRQSPVRRMKPDALLRLIRRVALKGALTDADVVVESQGGLVFLRRLLRHLLTRPVPPALLTFASSIHNYTVIEPIGYAKSNIRSPRCYVSCAGRSDAARHFGPVARGEASVIELAEPFAISQPAVSKHLKVLERAGLITVGQDAQRRPRRLEGKPLAEANAWLERYRASWEASFERLDGVLEELKRSTSTRGRRRPPSQMLRRVGTKR